MNEKYQEYRDPQKMCFTFYIYLPLGLSNITLYLGIDRKQKTFTTKQIHCQHFRLIEVDQR